MYSGQNHLVLAGFQWFEVNISFHFPDARISPKSKGVNPWFWTSFRLISNLRNKLKIWKLKPNLLVLALFHWFEAKISLHFPGPKISPKSKGVNPWSWTSFRPISNLPNKLKIWKLKLNLLVFALFHWFEANISLHFPGPKISPKSKGVNPWSWTSSRPISNLRNKLKIWKLKPNLLVLALFHWFEANILFHFPSPNISPKSKRVNPWFVTILWPISNLRNKLKILKLKPNLLVLALFHWFEANISLDFPGPRISPKSKGVNLWFWTGFRSISNLRN